MALDTLRPAFRPPSDVPLNHTGRRVLRRRPGAVCAQLHFGWSDRRFRSGMAADRGRVLCALDRIPPGRWVKPRHGNVENCRLCRWKTFSQPMEKDRPFPTACKQVSHSSAGAGSLHTFPQRLLRRISILSFPILKKKMKLR